MLWGLGLRRFVKKGSLRIIDAYGKSHHYGVKGKLPFSSIRLHSPKLHYQLLFNPDLHLGEAYMDQTLTLEEGTTLHDLLNVFGINLDDGPQFFMEALETYLTTPLNRILQHNPLRRSKANVAHHYDLSNDFYRLFLDEDMQYSCAYFVDPNMTLEAAQLSKKTHIAKKLLLKPGMRVLDIGCGWGGLAMFLAQKYDVEVTGITLSQEQYTLATERVKNAGLDDKVKFYLRDYRHETGVYDRIVSVGMFEHVGPSHYKEFFRKVRSLLNPEGVALLHSIGRNDGPETTNAWLRKYIFPGAGAPALSEVVPVVEKSGLWTTDIEILRLHYAYTLDIWYERFQNHRASIALQYDERFCRMWEFYLASCAAYFRHCDVMVFQIQLARGIGAVPITRNYLYTA